jgi:hypothetical protein
MQGANSFYGPVYYVPTWVLVGLVFLLAAATVVGLILYTTRKKTIKNIETLKPLEPKIVDLNTLKKKYLGMIDQIETYYNDHRTSASVAHQQMSKAVRLFYYEALGFHAEVMTLRDLKRSNYKNLSLVIEKYYPDEFDMLEEGLVAQSAERARELIRKQ